MKPCSRRDLLYYVSSHALARYLCFDYIPNQVVDILEPVAQLGVLLSIVVDGVQRLKEVIQGGVVGETLDKSAQVVLDSLHTVGLNNITGSGATLLGNVLGVASVLLGHVQQGLHSLLV
jgi:hypothetical protein